jgi:hypothetical protein
MPFGLLSFAAPRYPHNGGRAQVNLNFLQIGGDYPFMNHLKTAQYWSFITNPTPTAPVSPDSLDDDGYPTSISNNGIYTRFFIPRQSARSGAYRVKWRGIGTIYCPNATSITGSKTSATADGGSFTFTPTTHDINLGISSIGATHITDLSFVHIDDIDDYDSGAVFNTYFKQKIKDGGFGVLRAMNWFVSNQCQASTWWTRRSPSYAYYSSSEYRPSIYCGETTNSGNDYSAAAPAICSATGAAWDGVLRDKTTVSVIFNVSATQSGLCSLDVGGTGPKNILNMYCNPLTAGGNSYPVGQTYQSLATLVYDSAIDAWIKQGGDAGSNSQGLNNGVPPELFLRLCEEVGAHPYVVAPHYALAPATDYMSSLAAYYRANSPSWMVPLYEGPNEQWNTFTGFTSVYYTSARQAFLNGVKFPGGVLTNTNYAASAMVYPVDVSGGSYVSGQKYMKITLSTTGNAFLKGSRFAFGANWSGVSSLNNQQGYVTGINIDGDPNTITAYVPYVSSMPDGVPASGTYTSGGTITPNANDYYNWYGQAMSELGQIISTEYSGNRAKYQVVCGVQTGTGDTTGNLNNSIPRMTALSYVLRADPQSPFTATPASDWVTTLAITTYFTPSNHGSGTETTQAAAYAGATFTGAISGTTLTTSSAQGTIAIGMTIQGIGDQGAAVAPGTVITGGSGTSWTVNNSQTVPSQRMVGGVDLTVPIDYEATVDSGSGAFTLTKLETLFANWKAWAQGYGVQRMVAYEGGYSPDLSNSNGNSNVDRLRIASKLAPDLETHTLRILNSFVGMTDETFTAEYPSLYLLASNPHINGYSQAVWSVMDDIYQYPPSPQWNAIVAFNNP